ncbi:MAG: TVP38/TMEM64 family protein [Verrucomicrobiales bacterium]
MRILRLFLILAAVVLVPFLLWGDRFDAWFSGDAAVEWLRRLGPWGWLGGIGLLMADLVLPVPGTAVMSALGFVYGPWTGGVVSAVGSFLSGSLAYGLTRWIDPRWAAKLAGEAELKRYHALFAKSGAWIVALSRWLPLMPEVVACLAGLSRMPARPFFVALACGSLPLGFAFAAIGAAGQKNPVLALALSALVPALLIFAARRWINHPAP